MHPSELLGSAWTKPTKNVLAPNVIANIAHFNKLGWWVLTEVLSNRDKSARAKAMVHFIKTADVRFYAHAFLVLNESLGIDETSKLQLCTRCCCVARLALDS